MTKAVNAEHKPSKIKTISKYRVAMRRTHRGQEIGERSRKVERNQQRPFDSSAASVARPTTATAPTFSNRRASNGTAVQQGRNFGGLDMAPDH
jgi:hypothetical protein